MKRQLYCLVFALALHTARAQNFPQPKLPDITVQAKGGNFVFRDLTVWRYSEVRGEMIPELAGTVENRTGMDWDKATFRVRVFCHFTGLPLASSGAQQAVEYDVTLYEITVGTQRFQSTAYSYFDRVSYCTPSSAELLFLDGIPTPPASVPTYVIFHFSYQVSQTETSGRLEGIIGRTRTVSRFWPLGTAGTTRRTDFFYLGTDGRKLVEEQVAENSDLYCFQVSRRLKDAPIDADPEAFALGGFIISEKPYVALEFKDVSLVYKVPLGKAAYIGSFRIGGIIEKSDEKVVGYMLDGGKTRGYRPVRVELSSEQYQAVKQKLGDIDGSEIVLTSFPTVTAW